ncbi:MAG: hypothetical protein R3F19_15810 [Verrucomicrobiales bacterium]
MIHQFPIGRNLRAGTTLGMAALLLLVACLLAGFPLQATAQLTGPGSRIPRVENISNLRVVRGKILRIKLEASTESPTRMEFIINKDQLKHGTLSEWTVPNPEKKHIAFVDYTPTLAGPDAVETFTYRVKQTVRIPDRDAPVDLSSSTATVTINVEAAYPELVANEIIEFGDVYVGSTVERLWTVSNKGGASYRQTIKIPNGFSVTGLDKNNSLEIPPQETRRIKLIYHPTEIGRMQERLELPGHKGASTETLIYATGVAPFHGAPSSLQLEWVPENESRTGKLEIASAMDKTIDIAVSAPAILNLPNIVTLGKRAAQTFEIDIPAKNYKDVVEGSIEMTFETFKLSIPVRAEGIPAYLDAVGNTIGLASIEFPEGTESPPVTLSFINNGVSEGTLFTDIHHEFLLEGASEGQIIAPGESLTLTVKPAHNIRATGPLVLKCGNQRLEYSLISEPAKTDDAPGGAGATVEIDESTALLATKEGSISHREGFGEYGSTRAKLSGPELAADLFAIRVEGNYKFDHTLPKVETTEFIDGGRDFLEFSWPPLTPGDFDYKVHVETIQLDEKTGHLRTLWARRNVPITQNDGKYEARLDGLNPGMAYRVRIVGVTPDGRATLSEPFRFVTAVPRQLRYLIGTWTVTLLCVASLAIIIYRRIQRRRFYQRFY